jgi:hypothetical protein
LDTIPYNKPINIPHIYIPSPFLEIHFLFRNSFNDPLSAAIMCYIEASYYIHCTYLNVQFWTCDDLNHGHLRPNSGMHSYRRLCPACFTEKYVRAEGEGMEMDETAVEAESEDDMEGLTTAVIPTTCTPGD